MHRRQPGPDPGEPADEATVAAIAESGVAAVAVGAVESGIRLLRSAVRQAGRAGYPRAATYLDQPVLIAERDHWLAFLPWPQALRGEVLLAVSGPAAAAGVPQQAFARACQLADPRWEGLAARSLALVAEAQGDTDRAFALRRLAARTGMREQTIRAMHHSAYLGDRSAGDLRAAGIRNQLLAGVRRT